MATAMTAAMRPPSLIVHRVRIVLLLFLGSFLDPVDVIGHQAVSFPVNVGRGFR
jgi:hypothetical protein